MREWIKAMAAILAEFGIQDYEIRSGGKHPKLCFEFAGAEHRITFPSTSSDKRALLNKKSALRRYLNERK